MPEYTKGSFTAHGVQAFNPAGALTELGEKLSLSQAIVLPPNAQLVVTSGQCGFKEDGSLSSDKHEQISELIANADKTLREAGCKDGLKNVYQYTLYYPSLDDEFIDALVTARDRYLGDNRPANTGVSVAGLYGGAVLEITFYAYIPK
ncbi:hypothetical protein M409DRAFT_28930 [Zasmidium cellare ATCC 36951]|uniref:Uncharacterized protein n=1 Tax=Zasmidium cellare ATCC 36951 TaxID=1080233 RepID=A0A6A6C580_ZASCE|nr:uncharacterized protein M409DRAFT_28930 [Zasmidium cellare ATCC 36951]KAF2160546.1 hypothetical protein M409DRAFT_28930 [Zasmidium cellare ATCC 36951]